MSDTKFWKCTTVSGAIYLLEQGGSATYLPGMTTFPQWVSVDREGASTLPEVLRREIKNEPEIGRALYCEGGYPKWRLSTNVEKIEEIDKYSI